MKHIRSQWFSGPLCGPGCIGIIHTINEAGQRKAYLGMAPGLSQEADTERIMQHGTKVHPNQAKDLFEHIFHDNLTSAGHKYEKMLDIITEKIRTLEEASRREQGFAMQERIIIELATYRDLVNSLQAIETLKTPPNAN